MQDFKHLSNKITQSNLPDENQMEIDDIIFHLINKQGTKNKD